MIKRVSLPGWVLAVSLFLFVVTWAFAPAETSGSLLPAGRMPISRLKSVPPADQFQPHVHPVALTNEPRTVYGFSQPYWVAFTFDDGPHAIYTGRLLDLLKEYGVPATFFVNGYWLDPRARSDASRARSALLRVHREGHTIGNHTYSHANLASLPLEQQTWQILANEILVEATVGRKPRLFRPPYGQMTAHARRVIRDHGYVETRWNVSAADETHKAPDTIAAAVLRWLRHHKGGIVLLHDRNRHSITATRLVLERVTKDNCRRLAADKPTYQIVPLDAFLRTTAELRAHADELARARQQHLRRLRQLCRGRS